MLGFFQIRYWRSHKHKEELAYAIADRGPLFSEGPKAQHPRILTDSCIGCGACVAACPNASAMLFTSAKVTHLNSLPQGQPQRDERTLSMVATMRNEIFGSCTNHGECEAVCPKQIPIEFIGRLTRDFIGALWHRHRQPLTIPSVVQLPCAEDAHEHLHDDIRLSQQPAGRHLQEDVPADIPRESTEHVGTSL